MLVTSTLGRVHKPYLYPIPASPDVPHERQNLGPNPDVFASVGVGGFSAYVGAGSSGDMPWHADVVVTLAWDLSKWFWYLRASLA